jgi:tRNA(adenine34) deaminase
MQPDEPERPERRAGMPYLRPATDEDFMRMALAEARAAEEGGEVPVGAIAVHEGAVIARAHNQREILQDPTAHAEMLCITQAAERLEQWRLEGVTIYVTLEPCSMCAGALVLARIDRLVFGATDPKAGACGSLMTLHQDPRLNHSIPSTSGVLAGECGELLSSFFARMRRARG